MSDTGKKRYAAVGTGGRVIMFIDPVANEYKEYGEVVGLCDSSQVRAAYHQQRLVRKYNHPQVPIYSADDFERMIKETRPDVIIVCTMDATHHEYIIKALHLGCDVITEKPMTTDDEKCRAIFEAVRQTGRNVRVSFNYRWTPGTTKVRELIASGVIGQVKAVNLEYLLNTSHGADYFRRWHSQKECSGGLLVHKSTHHFDLVNWWIDAVPEEVFAWGDLMFYGLDNALKRGDEAYTRYERYTGSAEAKGDPFAMPIEQESEKEIYLNAEEESGYLRDRNVFREGITIEDTMAVLVRYRTGALLNYSLNAFSPAEGYRVTFTGDRGRIEYSDMAEPHVPKGRNKGEPVPHNQNDNMGTGICLRVIPHFQNGYDVHVAGAQGGHGGGDPLLQEQIFSSRAPQEIWGRNAGHEQGAASILVGVAANRSMATGQPVRIGDLCEIKPNATRLSQLI